jgi:hypothetical protein
MAENVHEYAAATGNDYAEHERTYALVMKLSKVATASLILIVISLAIGGVAGAWSLAGLGIVLALVTGVIGGVSEKGSVAPVIVAGIVVLALWLFFG